MVTRVEFLGPTGAGKTSLLRALASQPSSACPSFLPVFEEFRAFAPAFTVGQEGSSVATTVMQACFYWATYERAKLGGENSTIVVLDHSLGIHHYGYSQYFYEAALLTAQDWLTLTRLYEALAHEIGPPALAVVCALGDHECRQRLAIRGRAGDPNVPAALMASLQRACTYPPFVTDSNVLRLDMQKPLEVNAELVRTRLVATGRFDVQ